MYYRRLSDKEILSGFRKGNADIIRDYFYGYCEVGYNIFDQRYQLRGKQNLDFMSLAHQYAIFLMEHDWKTLEDHSPNISLKTWLINGFRYVVLDALKWYKKEYGSITFEDYLRSFDVTSDLRLQFNRMVEDVCDHVPMGRDERLIIHMMLLRGFKGKEVAAQMGLTPAAISQKYGTEENDSGAYHIASAKRDIRIRQQPSRYARWRCSLCCLTQVRRHHGSGCGTAGPELRHPHDAGWGRNYPSVCG